MSSTIPGGLRHTCLRLNHNAPDVTHLDLQRLRINNAGARDLAQALRNNTILLELNLSCNRIRNEGAQAIAHLLCHNSTVQIIDLSDNQFRDEGAVALGMALPHNNGLRYLALNKCDIDSQGCIAIAKGLAENSTLLALQLHNNTVGDVGAQSIGAALSTNMCLRVLGLGENNIGNDGIRAICNGLSINDSVTHLYLNGNNFAEAGVVAIGNILKINSRITHLDLGEVLVGADGEKSLLKGVLNNFQLQHFTIYDGDIQVKVDYYTRLNRIGHRQILAQENVPAGLWAFVLSRFANDIDQLGAMDAYGIVYYFLQSKPELCKNCLGAPTEESTAMGAEELDSGEPISHSNKMLKETAKNSDQHNQQRMEES